jgi:hypothetical protein
LVEIQMHEDRHLADFEAGRSRQMLLDIVGSPPQALHDVTLIGRWGVCHDGDDTDPSRLLQSKAPLT